MSVTENTSTSWRVGDRASVIHSGDRRVNVTLVEDRGPVGARGRRMWRVSVPQDPDEPVVRTVPEEELLPPLPQRGSLTDGEIVDFLENGGLVSLLRTNLAGGRAPSVWLVRDPLGQVTYSMIEGELGGHAAPFQALFESVVFRPKEREVVEFLMSFGITKALAEQVVHRVGLRP